MTAQERSGAIGDSAARPAHLGWLRAAVADRESLRSWTQVGNDGIIATAGILEGFAGAGAANQTLITAGIMATVAGMLTVGGAEWAEAAAERDAHLTAAAEEADEIARQPRVEHAELVAYYQAKGLTPQLAGEVADQLMAGDPLAAQLESEHGILEVTSRAATVRKGIGSAIAYLLGAAIPLIVTVAVPRRELGDPWGGTRFLDRDVGNRGAHWSHEPFPHPRPRAHRRSRDDGRELPRRQTGLLTVARGGKSASAPSFSERRERDPVSADFRSRRSNGRTLTSAKPMHLPTPLPPQ